MSSYSQNDQAVANNESRQEQGASQIGYTDMTDVCCTILGNIRSQLGGNQPLSEAAFSQIQSEIDSVRDFSSGLEPLDARLLHADLSATQLQLEKEQKRAEALRSPSESHKPAKSPSSSPGESHGSRVSSMSD